MGFGYRIWMWLRAWVSAGVMEKGDSEGEGEKDVDKAIACMQQEVSVAKSLGEC